MASDQKTQIIVGFFLVGVGLISLSLYQTFKSTDATNSEPVLARVERETGKVTIFKPGFTQKEAVSRRSALKHQDSVETDETGEATISFETAYRVKVLFNSLVTIERTDDLENLHSILTIKRGQIQIENYGREGTLFISKNGEKVSASEYQSSPLANAVIESPSIDTSTVETPSQRSTLSQEEIQTVLDGQKTSFYKCYTQLLQKLPEAKGFTNITFNIENSGNIANVQIASSQINNEDFKKCIKEVVNRISFKAFTGPTVSSSFPLQFE